MRGVVSGGSAKSRRFGGGGLPPRGPKYQGLPRWGDTPGKGIYTPPGDEGRRDLRREGRGTGGGGGRREERGTGRAAPRGARPAEQCALSATREPTAAWQRGRGAAPAKAPPPPPAPPGPSRPGGGAKRESSVALFPPSRGAAAPGTVRERPSPLPAARPGEATCAAQPPRSGHPRAGEERYCGAVWEGSARNSETHAASCLEFSTPAARFPARWKRSRRRGSPAHPAARPSLPLPPPPGPGAPRENPLGGGRAGAKLLFPRSVRGGGRGRGSALAQVGEVVGGGGRASERVPIPHIRRDERKGA